MSENSQKGRALERAVKFIQQTLLESDPKLRGIKFTIENNVVLNVAGVRHEIDVLVKTLPGSDYESVCAFECKNRKNPVTKNDVIVLTAKVEAVGANRGILIGYRFTRDAHAQAKLDRRLNLIACADEFLSPLNASELWHVMHETLSLTLRIKERGVLAKGQPERLDWKRKECRLKSRSVDLVKYVNGFVQEMAEADRKNNRKYESNSSHFAKLGCRLQYDPSELFVGDLEVEYMDVIADCFVQVRQKRIISKFELKGQGRCFSFEPLEDLIPGKLVEVIMVERFRR